MSASKCCLCGKTAYPLEKITAGGKDYHKACFKCKTCGITLNLKTFNYDKGTDAVYCKIHLPKATFTNVTDSVELVHEKNVPKKDVDNLGTVQKGQGSGKPLTTVFGASGSGQTLEQQQAAEEQQ